jgi:hypothetical protein
MISLNIEVKAKSIYQIKDFAELAEHPVKKNSIKSESWI